MKNISKRNFFKGVGAIMLSSFSVNINNNLLAHSEKNDDRNNSNFGKDKDALIVVDVQNDFCPGGSLAVKDGNKIVSYINEVQKRFNYVFYTQDWHPKDHISFSTNNKGKEVFSTIDVPYGKQVIWPPHCIFNTEGANFHKDLEVKRANAIIRKGFRKNIDSYSGFFENDKITPTGLEGLLKSLKIERVFICGLALDFCVNYTAIDAKNLGFETIVIKGATLPVNIGNSVKDTLQGFKDKGIHYGGLKNYI